MYRIPRCTSQIRSAWPTCSQCRKAVPALCDLADDDAQPCGLGIRCGCCTAPHTRAELAVALSEDDVHVWALVLDAEYGRCAEFVR